MTKSCTIRGTGLNARQEIEKRRLLGLEPIKIAIVTGDQAVVIFGDGSQLALDGMDWGEDADHGKMIAFACVVKLCRLCDGSKALDVLRHLPKTWTGDIFPEYDT